MNIIVNDSVNISSNNKESDYVIYSKKSLLNQNQTKKIKDNTELYNTSVSFNKEKTGVLMDNGAFDKSANSDSEKISLKEKLNNLPDSKLYKDYLTVMSNTLSKEDYKKLKEDGYNPLSDDPAKMVNVSERIKARLLEAGEVIPGYNDDFTRDELADITGSDVQATYLCESLGRMEINPNDDVINEGREAVNKAMNLEAPIRSAIDYMVRENMEPTIANLYMQKYSFKNGEGPEKVYFKDAAGYMNVSELNKDKEDNTDIVETQIRKIMESYNIEESEENVSLVKDMVNENLAVTDKSFDLYKRLRLLKFPLDEKMIGKNVGYAISSGRRPEDAVCYEDKPLLQKALDIVTNMKDISDKAVISDVVNNKPFNIRALSYESRYIGISSEVNRDVSDEMQKLPNVVKAMRVMNEIRVSMTVSSTYTLLRNGIDVNTKDLNLLVEDLKEAENRQFESIFGKNTSGKVLNDLYEETTSKVESLKNMPLAAFRFAVSSKSYSLNMIYSEAVTVKEQYIRAGKSYETMATQVRGDLGDSIKKAFGNIGEILSEINAEDNEENQRAARILGYNQMEINVENLEKIKDGVNKVQSIIEKMSPRNVIELIREGINPLEVDMNELNDRLNLMAKENDSPELFSEYLVKLDEKKAITSDERSSYIGIYRMIKNIEKNDMAAVGTLINSKAEINFKNLLGAVRTRKAKGMDVKLGDNEEITKRIIKEGASISEQIGKAFISVGEYESKTYLTDYEKELIDQSALLSEDVTEFLLNENISLSVENLLSADNLFNGKSNIYSKVRELISRDNNYELQDEEASGDEINVAEYDEIIRDLGNVSEDYNKVYNEAIDRLSEFINTNSDKLADINTLRELSLSLKGLQLSKSLSQNDFYEVPVKKGDMIYSVKFKFTKGEYKGVSLTSESERFGVISGRFEYSSGRFEGVFYYNRSSSKDSVIDELRQNLLNDYEKNNIPVGDINFIENSKNNSAFKVNVFDYFVDINNRNEEAQGREFQESTEAVTNRVLYNLAKVFIENIGM